MIYTVLRTNSVRVSTTAKTAPTPVSKRHRLLQITSHRNRQTGRCSCSRHSSNRLRRLRGRRQRCGCVRRRLRRIPKTVARQKLRRFRSLLPTGWLKQLSNVVSCWWNCPRTNLGWSNCTCVAKKSIGRWVHRTEKLKLCF